MSTFWRLLKVLFIVKGIQRIQTDAVLSILVIFSKKNTSRNCKYSGFISLFKLNFFFFWAFRVLAIIRYQFMQKMVSFWKKNPTQTYKKPIFWKTVVQERCGFVIISALFACFLVWSGLSFLWLVGLVSLFVVWVFLLVFCCFFIFFLVWLVGFVFFCCLGFFVFVVFLQLVTKTITLIL